MISAALDRSHLTHLILGVRNGTPYVSLGTHELSEFDRQHQVMVKEVAAEDRALSLDELGRKYFPATFPQTQQPGPVVDLTELRRTLSGEGVLQDAVALSSTPAGGMTNLASGFLKGLN